MSSTLQDISFHSSYFLRKFWLGSWVQFPSAKEKKKIKIYLFELTPSLSISHLNNQPKICSSEVFIYMECLCYPLKVWRTSN